MRQFEAACSRSACDISNWTSFSAWAKSSGVTTGPTGVAVPKAGGAPGVACWFAGTCWPGAACAPSEADSNAAARAAKELEARNCRREEDMRDPFGTRGNGRRRKPSPDYMQRDDRGTQLGGDDCGTVVRAISMGH